MGKPAPPLEISTTARQILEALLDRKDVPQRIKRRARIILLAATGLANTRIAHDLHIGTAHVAHWRKRFEDKGIRGLWEHKGTPRQPIAPEIEQNLVMDALYDYFPIDRLAILAGAPRRSTRDLAKRHGVSTATAGRIMARHGIRFDRLGRVEVEKLKMSQDVLFGVRISEIAGLFYDRLSSTLALSACSSISPLTGLTRWEVALEVEHLAQILHEFGENRYVKFSTTFKSTAPYLEFLQQLEQKRKADETIYLIADSTSGLPLGLSQRDDVKSWIVEHAANYVLYPQPFGSTWSAWVDRWLQVITNSPVQDSFVKSVRKVSALLNELPKSGQLEPLVHIRT